MELRGDRFVDEKGRTLLLRGVNLGGDSKYPAKPNGRTDLKDGFYEGGAVSFVGRPFPLEQADEHFARLASWGQNFLRLIVTWEAIEHEGPGIYDEAYLDYVEGIVEAAERRGISLFVDPHQDVWSRWTGGDGAPLWTLEAVGFEPRSLHASGAALVHQEAGASYPRMQWFSNHLRLACATMFTLFFGGNDFAPGIEVEEIPVQDYLQGHYLAAMAKLAARLASHGNVVGMDSLNEPGDGYIGLADLRALRPDLVMPGMAPTAWEAIQAGEGLAVDAEERGIRGLGIVRLGRRPLGSPGVRAWKEGMDCIWRRVGLWDYEGATATLRKPNWFAERLGTSGKTAAGGAAPRASAFSELYLKPFIARFADAVRGAAPNARRFAVFVEGPPSGARPSWGPGELGDIVNSTHWYDDFTLVLKRWTGFLAYDAELGKPVIGPKAVRRYFVQALARVVRHSREHMGDCPSLLGEFGLPFDLNGRKAYRTGNFHLHEKALSTYYDALDANFLNATLWDYSASNTHAWGDGWNGEDLSVFSEEDGGRALAGFVRPYARSVAGEPRSMSFSLRTGSFDFSWKPDHEVAAPTEIFVPGLQYPLGFSVQTEGCRVAERGEKTEGGPTGLELEPEPGTEWCRVVLRRLK